MSFSLRAFLRWRTSQQPPPSTRWEAANMLASSGFIVYSPSEDDTRHRVALADRMRNRFYADQQRRSAP